MPLTIRTCVLSHKQKNNFSENQLVLPGDSFRGGVPR